jgi:hypothetical protein
MVRADCLGEALVSRAVWERADMVWEGLGSGDSTGGGKAGSAICPVASGRWSLSTTVGCPPRALAGMDRSQARARGMSFGSDTAMRARAS